MVHNYEIGKVETYQDEVFMRNVPLKVGDKSIPGFTRSIAGPIDKKTIDQLKLKPENLINEIRLKLTLPLLREIDSNKIKRRKFFSSENAKFLKESFLNMFVIEFTLEEKEKLEKEDINYLNYILTYELNDLYVMPIVRFNGMPGQTEASKEYDTFVTRMLESKNEMIPGDLKVGISIPSGYEENSYSNLFSKYANEKKKPDFVLMDFNNRTTIHSDFLGNIPRVIQFFKKEGKEKGEEEQYEKYYLYGFNIKPYRRGSSESKCAAEDVRLILMGFNAFGHQYQKRMGGDNFANYEPKWKSLRTFWSNDYKYHHLEGGKEKRNWDEWVDLVYGEGTNASIPNPNDKARKLSRRYNFVSLNKEFSELTRGVIKSDADLLKEKFKNKDIPDEITSRFGKPKNDKK